MKESKTREFRCLKCSKKLAVGSIIRLEIKCPRCKTMCAYN
ncbi:Com family DNA-binding transcriptional regulator [Ignatzschineria larvae]